MIEATIVLSILALVFAVMSVVVVCNIDRDLQRDLENVKEEIATKQQRKDLPVTRKYRTYVQGEVLHLIDPMTKCCVICDETEDWIVKRINEG